MIDIAIWWGLIGAIIFCFQMILVSSAEGEVEVKQPQFAIWFVICGPLVWAFWLGFVVFFAIKDFIWPHIDSKEFWKPFKKVD